MLSPVLNPEFGVYEFLGDRLPRLCHDFLKFLDLPLILTEGLASAGLSREVRGVVSNAIALIKRKRDRIQTWLIPIPISF
jgi:hypothetical protein